MRYPELAEILLSDKPSVVLRKRQDELVEIIPEFKNSIGFDQENEWHPYDVFEHTLRVVDGVDNVFPLRLAALFHDIGKPYVKKMGEDGQAHYKFHWDKSKEIFIKHRDKFYVGFVALEQVCKLIEYHDLSIDIKNVKKFAKIFYEDEMDMLFDLKKADILAQNKKKIPEQLEKLEKQKQIYYSYIAEYKSKKNIKGKDDYSWTD